MLKKLGLTVVVLLPLLLQVYTGCEPDEHSCSTDPSLDEAASKASDEAVMSLMNSL